MRSHAAFRGLGFRGRLFAFLLAFALVPSILLGLSWGAMTRWVVPMVGATARWDSVAESGQRAIAGARERPTSPATRRALESHEAQLNEALTMSRRTSSIMRRAGPTVVLLIVSITIVFGLLAANIAGHLSRNLSRPLQELVEWTDLIARGEPLPTGPPRRGAPEFQLLRHRMQRMAAELHKGRQRALEAERAAALRESARQVAHELKNPLTPIRFAVARLRRHASPEIAEAVEVLEVETARLDAMARSFAQFGRLPEGPRAQVDLGELARYAARATTAPGVSVSVDVEPGTPMIDGHYDALSRALANIVINAVDACDGNGQVTLTVRASSMEGRKAAEVVVSDTGRGIEPEKLPRIFDPYVTTKAGGTGLGLAIVRQTILAHDGLVDATSVPGSGTSIRLVLPAEREADPSLRSG
ncbi:MAG TPA: HAMP domain-containing sensor histidine kinase [Gemmatimonadaceae bacterium]|nr:HAMP domain-containing sensor histidine kinase [Gemmatimonadaceae bacterium]